MNELVTTTSKALMSPETIQVLKDSLFKNFTDAEIGYCTAVVNQLQLSPLLRQVHFVKRKDNNLGRDVIVTQTGIDGFRLIAERTGKYAGSDEPIFEYEGSIKRQPTKASVTVWKIVDGVRSPFTASARWDEFYPGDHLGFMWKNKPHVMLGKCAESQSLRKAFPAELSSVYADEEMHRVDAADKKASRLQEKILNPETSPIIETEARLVDSEAGDLFSSEIPGDKYKGKVFGDLNPAELKHYADSVKKWFEAEKKTINPKWKEFFAKSEEYLKEVDI